MRERGTKSKYAEITKHPSLLILMRNPHNCSVVGSDIVYTETSKFEVFLICTLYNCTLYTDFFTRTGCLIKSIFSEGGSPFGQHVNNLNSLRGTMFYVCQVIAENGACRMPFSNQKKSSENVMKKCHTCSI